MGGQRSGRAGRRSANRITSAGSLGRTITCGTRSSTVGQWHFSIRNHFSGWDSPTSGATCGSLTVPRSTSRSELASATTHASTTSASSPARSRSVATCTSLCSATSRQGERESCSTTSPASPMDAMSIAQSDDYSGRTMTNPTVAAKYKHETEAAVRIGRHSILGHWNGRAPRRRHRRGRVIRGDDAVQQAHRAMDHLRGFACETGEGERTGVLDLEQALLDDEARNGS